MSEVIPVRRVMELLRHLAVDRRLNVSMFGGVGLSVMCNACYPIPQPERLQYSERKVRPVSLSGDAPWFAVLHEECDGLATIRYPRGADPRALLSAEDAVSALVVSSCCHDEDNALGGWHWRSELAGAVAEAIESAGDEWAGEVERRRLAREAQEAERGALQAAYDAGQALTPRERVRAVAGVLKAAGKQVKVEQARVSWECGHITQAEEGQKAGEWERLVIVVNDLPTRADESCTLQHEDDAPDVSEVAAEFERVAAMTPEERAKYDPVPETRPRRGGPPWARSGGGSSRPKAEPKPVWTDESTRAWLVEHGFDPALPVQALWKLVGKVEGHPPRKAIEAMKKAAGPG